MRALVLFSGTGSVEKVLREKYPGIEVVSVDNDGKWNPTHLMSVEAFERTHKYPVGHFDIIWASPPCTEYSRAKTTKPRELPKADRIAKSALRLISSLRPKTWFVENPVGMLKDRSFMKPYSKYMNTATYCMYGTPYRKATNFWTNKVLRTPLMKCSKETPCANFRELGHHEVSAQKGHSGKLGPGNYRQKGMGVGTNVYPIPRKLMQALLR